MTRVCGITTSARHRSILGTPLAVFQLADLNTMAARNNEIKILDTSLPGGVTCCAAADILPNR